MEINSNILDFFDAILKKDVSILSYQIFLKGNYVLLKQDIKKIDTNNYDISNLVHQAKIIYDDCFIENGFLNIVLCIEKYFKVTAKLFKRTGKLKEQDERITIDMSSPNVGRPMTYYHLRSTLIGNTLANIYNFLGYKVFKINHLGDWGMPVSSIITAIQKWGDKNIIESNPMVELNNLYIRYLDELMIQPNIEEQALITFKKLTYQDEEVTSILLWLKKLSLDHFNSIYDKFGVTFDSIKGESFYDCYSRDLIQFIDKKDKIYKKHGSLFVRTNKSNILIQDSHNYSTYLSRDLIAAIYRYKHYSPSRLIYIVGKEQSDHFNSLIDVLRELDYPLSRKINHIGYSQINVENDQKEVPTKKDTMIISLIERLEQYVSNQYNQNAKISEYIAINGLIFHFLDAYRNDILTININHLNRLLDNYAYKALELNKKLEVLFENLTYNDKSIELTKKISDIDLELAWILANFNRVLNEAATKFETVYLTNYLKK